MHRSKPRAFTLVELLVVITIIIVLLALLMPAMDKAVYQAELAVCGATLRAMTTNVLDYTIHNRRFYPYRKGVEGTENWWQGKLSDVQVDDRAAIQRALGSYKLLLDPMSPKGVDLSPEAQKNPASDVTGNYELWFGWRYTRDINGSPSNPQQPMRRLGDRWGWMGQTFNLLACDGDRVSTTVPFEISSHPDRGGVLAPFVFQDALVPTPYTLSRWEARVQPDVRGNLDLNFAYDDGSVRRLDDLPYDEWRGTGRERTTSVPYYNGARNYGDGTEWLQVPKP
jgi:hypothetical protein